MLKLNLMSVDLLLYRFVILIKYLYITSVLPIYVTGSGKTGLICATNEIHFLSVLERSTQALPRNTKYFTIGGQVCFYR